MSLEAAKKLLAEVNREDFEGKTEEELALFLKEKGYDCSIEELKKAYILSETLSEDEMAKVTGGRGNGCPHAAKKNISGFGSYADGDGSCCCDYYVEACSDTVEKDSFCWSGDYSCFFSGRHYTVHCLSTVEESGSSGGRACYGVTG